MKKGFLKKGFFIITLIIISVSSYLIAQEQKDSQKTDKKKNSNEQQNLTAGQKNPFESLPEIVAKVGDINITRQQLMDNSKDYLKNANTKMMDKTMLESLARDLVKMMINKTINLQLAKKDGFSSDNQELDKEYQNSEMKYPKDIFIINKWFEKKLVSNISDEDSEKEYRNNQDKLKVEESVNASHIFLKNQTVAEQNAKKNALKKAKEILKKIKAGEDFAKLARENSDCPSGAKGGDLGDFERGKMVKPFEDTTFSMKPGEISDIIETPFGYHIIKLNSVSEDKANASHILIRPEEPEEENTKLSADEIATNEKLRNENKAKTKQILAEFKQGKDFAELAKKYSDCRSAQGGGNIGDVRKGDTIEIFGQKFDDALFSLKPGETSGVVESDKGFHIIQLHKKNEAGFVPFEQVKQEIKYYLAMKKLEKLQEEFKAKNKIENFVPPPQEKQENNKEN